MEININLEVAEKQNWKQSMKCSTELHIKLLSKEKTDLCNTAITSSPYFYLLIRKNGIHIAVISSTVNTYELFTCTIKWW